MCNPVPFEKYFSKYGSLVPRPKPCPFRKNAGTRMPEQRENRSKLCAYLNGATQNFRYCSGRHKTLFVEDTELLSVKKVRNGIAVRIVSVEIHHSRVQSSPRENVNRTVMGITFDDCPLLPSHDLAIRNLG